jgi:hypothetical protein
VRFDETLLIERQQRGERSMGQFPLILEMPHVDAGNPPIFVH